MPPLKKTRLITIIAVITLITLIVLFLFGVRCFFIRNNVLEEVVSPDEQYVAVIFEVDSGALGSSFALEILKDGDKINSLANGNAFRSHREFSVEWIDDNTLYVANGGSSLDIYRQKTSVKGIKIHYNIMKD